MSLIKSLQRQAPARRTDVDVPRTFLGFLEWVDVTPSAGQSELCRVAFDGAQPVDGEIARELFGPIDFDNLPMGCRDVVGAICGGRGGKSYVLVALRLVWGMLVRDLSPLAPGQKAYATVVAPNEKLRQEVVNYGLGVCRSKPELRALMRLPKGTREDDTPSEFGIWREDFKRIVTFSAATATRGGYAVRGRWHTDLALDECAFFMDASYKINDEEIFKAGKPRVLPGGQTLLTTTPYAEVGLAYETFRDNFGKPKDALVAHAPTLLLNDTPHIRAIVEAERRRDPDNARREYDAKFVSSGTTVFFEVAALEAALTDEPFKLQPHDQVMAGGDFGFRSDSSSLILVAIRGSQIHVFDGAEERPQEGAPLKPSKTVETFAQRIAGRCRYLMADGHYREAIAEHLEAHGLAYAPAPTQPAETYVRARMLLREGRVRVHAMDFRDRLVRQLREVHGKPISGGGMSIVHPRWAKGGHGDLAAAFVLALWQASGDAVEEQKPELGTQEWVTQQRERRQRRMVERNNQPWWRKTG
jgi:hypothetical protein